MTKISPISYSDWPNGNQNFQSHCSITVNNSEISAIMTSRTRQPPSISADAAMTIEEWQQLGKEALVLKCLSMLIDSTGDADVLAQRLYDNFHCPPAPLPEDCESTASPQSQADDNQNSPSEKDSLSDDDSDGDSPAKRRKKRVNHPKPTSKNGNDNGNKDCGDEENNPTQEFAQSKSC